MMKLNEMNEQIVFEMISNGDFAFTDEQLISITTYNAPSKRTEVYTFSDGTTATKTVEEQLSIDDFQGKHRFSERKNRNDERNSTGYEYSIGGEIAMLRKTIYKITQTQLAREFSKIYGKKCSQKDISDIELNNEKVINKFRDEISLYLGKGEERA